MSDDNNLYGMTDVIEKMSDVPEVPRWEFYFGWAFLYLVFLIAPFVAFSNLEGGNLFGAVVSLAGSAFSGLLLYYPEWLVANSHGTVRRKPGKSFSVLRLKDTNIQSLDDAEFTSAIRIRIVRYDEKHETKAASTLSDLYALSPDQFEQFIAKLWQEQGYDAWVTPSTGDRGIDVIASGHGKFVVIQAKKYASNNAVSRPDIQKTFAAGFADRADEIVVVTTSTFSQPAIEEAHTLSAEIPITLIDGARLDQILSTRKSI